MRRPLQTRDRICVNLVSLRVRSPYFGALEVTRFETATRHLLERAQQRGELVLGIDLSSPPRQLPPEELLADLVADWVPKDAALEHPEDYRTHRTLRCYQDAGADPFVTLIGHVGQLSWRDVATLQHWA